ncbi:MAG TPA: hypothetical protein VHQ86_05370, partial [Candidatus Saccharimonadia bacterium]|nr:hypothetical protein [Candidatus Saccharimonadia bacterium]
LQNAVDQYYLRTNTLPAALGQVSQLSPDVARRLSNYQYQVTGPVSYELCATFMTKHQVNGSVPASYATMPNPDEHDKGRQCFEYTELKFQPEPVPLSR